MTKVYVIGMGVGNHGLPSDMKLLISEADLLVGGSRLLERFPEYSGSRLIIKGPLSEVMGKIKEFLGLGKRVVVLADGDPLFFGIGKRILDSIGPENVIFFPGITTLQAAAAREKIPWDDVKVVSLHGRDGILPLLLALVSYDIVGVYTDGFFTPARIGRELVDTGIDIFSMIVLENIGEKNEKTTHLTLEEASSRTFSPLNFVFLKRTGYPEVPLRIGIDDDLFVHSKGLITKKEVRAVGISMLSIEKNSVVWDLGAGSGAVGIEASFLAREGQVISVEKDRDRCRLIRENIRRTGAWNVSVLNREVPVGLDSLPEPDRIFVGGGLNRDLNLIERVLKYLRPGGRIVIHTVLLESLSLVRGFFEDISWPCSTTQVMVSRSSRLGNSEYLKALNPVFIVSAQKPV